jgi:dipeptidyl aminopeptidase/acylaminoacyl peptidase
MKALILLFAVFLAGYTQAHAQQKFGLDDLGKLVTIVDPQLSPDGKSILVVVSRPNVEEDKNRSEIDLVDIATGRVRPLTFNRASAGHPRWSPDGEAIAFISTDGPGKDAHNQLFIIRMDGGEARKVTNSTTGVQQFTWRPDGKAFAFVQEDEPADKKSIEHGYDAFEVGVNSMLLRSKPQPSHIWLVDVNGGEAKKLTSGEWSLPSSYPPGTPASPLSWSPDGRFIAFQRNESAYSGEKYNSVELLDVQTGAIKSITGRKLAGQVGLMESYPSFSPDGKYISYWFPRDGVATGSEVFITGLSGTAGQSITHLLDREFFRSEWSADSRSVLVGANDGNTVSLWLQSLDGGSKKLPLGKLCVTGGYWYNYNLGKNNSVALIASSTLSPQELYYLSSPTATPRKLTAFNSEFAGYSFGKQETITWKSDSFLVNGIVTFPPDFDPGLKYPLVLRIHGGPQSASKEQFSAPVQCMVSHGYIVFEPNYRGSDNNGDAFCSAINFDAGEGPGKDVVRGIDELKKRPYIDGSKIAVSGWSYGGYMTTWLIGNYHFWRCAVAGAAPTDMFDEYAESDNGIVYKLVENGRSPYTDSAIKARWTKDSPISYATKVTTPTLLLSDVGDERVPVSQSYKYFRVLQDMGTDSKFIVFPVGGHVPGDPVRVREMNRYWLEWLDKYLKS